MHLILSLIGLLLCLTSFIVKAGTPDINIQGLNSSQESNVRSFLALSAEQCTTPKWRVEKLFKQADKDIDKALRALGYYHETINKKLSFTDDCWDAEFTVSAGEPVIVKQLKLQIIGEAEQHPVLKKILANLPLKQGDVLNHAAYEKIKQSLHSWMLEKGYLQAKWITKSLQVYVEKNQAEISLVMDSGPRHRFGEVTITQGVLDPHFVQRYQLIKEGDYYSSKRLAKTYNALANSIYYSHAEIKLAMDHIENTIVPIDIVLTPAKIHDFSIGLGYGTDIGPLGNFGYLNRRLNKQGHHFSFGAEASEVLSSVESAYIIPFAHSRHDHISIGAGYKYEQPDSFESQQAKFSVQYQHVYNNGWKQTLFVGVSYEQFTISKEENRTTLLVPGVRWEYTKMNDSQRPTDGYHFNFSVAGTAETLISDVAFIQSTVEGKYIYGLPWQARIITRAKVGATLTSNFSRLPPSYRFYAGGMETIRGYGYKELGPKDSDGEVIGGNLLTVVSAEYEQFITENWGIAAFIDAGNAFNTDDATLKLGSGVGIRWVSPIGPLRLDFAVPLNESNDKFQIHFAAGVQL